MTEQDGGTSPQRREQARSLREIRAERLLSIRELARLAEVAPGTICHIEAGRTTPRPVVVRSLVAALGVEPSEVLEFRRMMEVTGRGRGHSPSPPA
jgi:transcriptional regulator with XRE-family HTH domain